MFISLGKVSVLIKNGLERESDMFGGYEDEREDGGEEGEYSFNDLLIQIFLYLSLSSIYTLLSVVILNTIF